MTTTLVLLAIAAVIGAIAFAHRLSIKTRERETRATLADLAARAAGGSPERPLEVVSASLVESSAIELGCLACGHAIRVVEHRAETRPELLRVLDLRCPACGTDRRAYVRILAPH